MPIASPFRCLRPQHPSRGLLRALPVLLAGLLSACAAVPPAPPPVDPAAPQVQTLPLLVPPAAFRLAGGAVLQGRIHLVGGHTYFNGLPQHWVFDPAAGTWTEAAPQPEGCYGQAVVAHEGRLYASGGLNVAPEHAVALSEFACAGLLQVYDGNARRWLPPVTLPAPRFHHAAALVGEELFILGGQTVWEFAEGTADDEFDGLLFTNTPVAWAYHLKTGVWRTIASLPRVRVGPVALVREGRIWLIGGRSFGALSSVDVYDPASDTWSAEPDLPVAAAFAAGVAAPGQFVLTGGLAGSLRPQPQRLWLSQGADGVWRSAGALAAPRAGHGAFLVEGVLHVLGGYGREAPRTLERFRLP